MSGAMSLVILVALLWLAVAWFLWRREARGTAAAIASLAAVGAIAAGFAGAWLLCAAQAMACVAALSQLGAIGGGADLPAGEERLLGDALPGLSPASVRHLAGQGAWLDGRAGEVLTSEGRPVSHLHFLARGEAAVSSGGAEVGRCGAGQFVGEATVLSAEAATATVALVVPARLWSIEAGRLRETSRLHDDVRAAVDAAIRRSLTEKLVAANRAAASS